MEKEREREMKDCYQGGSWWLLLKYRPKTYNHLSKFPRWDTLLISNVHTFNQILLMFSGMKGQRSIIFLKQFDHSISFTVICTFVVYSPVLQLKTRYLLQAIVYPWVNPKWAITKLFMQTTKIKILILKEMLNDNHTT